MSKNPQTTLASENVANLLDELKTDLANHSAEEAKAAVDFVIASDDTSENESGYSDSYRDTVYQDRYQDTAYDDHYNDTPSYRDGTR